jgi:hypothetical protein
MQALDETVAVTRDDQWQYIRVPLSVDLPEGELHLHRDSAHGPITLSAPLKHRTKAEREESLRGILHKFDEAFAAGESFEIERSLCPPREVNL